MFFWFTNARVVSLPLVVMPAFVAFVIAAGAYDFSVVLGILALIGVSFCHLSVNLLDDYFDYKKRSAYIRKELVHNGIRARVGKCEYLVSGKATMAQLRRVILSFALVGAACGAVIFAFRGAVILYIALVAVVLGYSYSGGILQLSYRGLGNLVIWFISGPLVMAGVYYSAAGVISPAILFLSVPAGLMTANNAYIHDIMDCEPDKEVGRTTIATLINNKYMLLISLAGILIISYGVIVGGIVIGILHIAYLAVFLTAPLAIFLFFLMKYFLFEPGREFSPAFWMGPVQDWESIQESGIEWFMVRWFLARNLMMFFCLILAVVGFIFGGTA